MPYIKRDNLVIVGLFANQAPGIIEFLNDDHPDVLAFLGLDLDGKKKAKKAEIRAAYGAAEVAPVPVGTIGTFNGGLESAGRLYNGLDLAREHSETSVVFTDINNQEIVLDLATALTVCVAVGLKARTDFLKKQRLMRDIDAAVDDASLALIAW